MEIVRKITTTLYLVIVACFGKTLGNTVSLSSASGYVGESLELTCTFTPTTAPTLLTVNWFLNNNPDGIQRVASTCNSAVTPASYNISRYGFTCNGNTFKLKILSLQISDNSACWSCSVSFSSLDDDTPKASTCINVTYKDTTNLLLLLLLLLLLPLSIFIILICCGCLDCCKCCRIYDHYDESKCCYVTWYCLLNGCCSFFCCRPGSKMGNCFCGHADEKGCCGGCHSCEKKCGCGWPRCCKSKKMRSCGICYCHCCVGKKMDKGLGDTSMLMTGHQAFYPETKTEVHSSSVKLPPITSDETVELKEPKKKKKKKNKDKLNLGKFAEDASEETTKVMSQAFQESSLTKAHSYQL